MSVLIKGMDMPKDCCNCPCHNGENGRCQLTKEVTDSKRPYDCPLIEVPTPHGRLRRRIVYRGEVYNALESARINALDGILSDPYKEGFHDGIKRAIQILVNEIDDALTNIEAEEGAENDL